MSSNTLPDCDGHMVNMMQQSDVIYRSTPGGVTRYLANADGSVIKSGEDEDMPIGATVCRSSR